MTVKKIAIFGATGNTGLTTLAQAVQAGMSWDGRGPSLRGIRKGLLGVGGIEASWGLMCLGAWTPG